MKTIKTLSFALLLAFLPVCSNAQILEGIESEISGGGVSDSANAFDSGLWWLDLLLNVGVEPFYGLFFGFPGEPYLKAADYSPYPYADGFSGVFLPEGEEGKWGQGQFITHFQNNEGGLSGGFFQLKLYPTRYLGLDVNHLRLVENRFDNDERDYLNITNFNLVFNRVRMPRFHLYWGSGLMLLDGNTLYGSPSFTTGMDIFVKKPVSIHADFQMGAPNNVLVLQSQVRAQVHLDRFFISAGFSGLKAGDNFSGSWLLGSGIYF